MNAICGYVKYVFCCGCCKEKPRTPVQDVVERSIEPMKLRQIKTHHVMGSTDMVTYSQFFKQEKEVRDESIDGNT